ncbi:MAG: hypothetical protein NC394_09755 [Bacteroides sp.]|nr:hypothetical protein [Bacteroides sp.]
MSEGYGKKEEEARRRKRKRANILLAVGIAGLALFTAAVIIAVIALNERSRDRVMRKPVIYLYPDVVSEISVKPSFGGITTAYPELDPYGGEWNVTAYPDGTLVDGSGEEYGSLFWEAEMSFECDFSEGFCVKGSDTAAFLRRALSEQGLTSREYNEFIAYWLPFMQDNAYNVISFQGSRYEESAPLEISPAPDCIKRVFMAYYPCAEEKTVPPQVLCGFERKGFTVVEWGGVCADRPIVR